MHDARCEHHRASTGCEAENAFNREEEGKEIRRGRSLVGRVLYGMISADQQRQQSLVIRVSFAIFFVFC